VKLGHVGDVFREAKRSICAGDDAKPGLAEMYGFNWNLTPMALP
jgi:hypothetical protein